MATIQELAQPATPGLGEFFSQYATPSNLRVEEDLFKSNACQAGLGNPDVFRSFS